MSFDKSISGGTTTGTITLNLIGSTVNSGFDNTIGGAITDGGAAGGVAVNIIGNSASSNMGPTYWTFNGTNTYSGPTTITNGGLDMTTTTATLSPLSTLILNSSVINYKIGGTQTVNGVTINSGASEFILMSGSTINLGAITRNVGSTCSFSGTMMTTATNDASGILGPWAFAGGGYATVSNGNITGFTGATAATTGNFANVTGSTTNYTYSYAQSSNLITLTGNITGNTLVSKFTGSPPSNGNLTIANAGHSITLNGIFVISSGYSNNLTLSGTGTVNIGSDNELDIYNTIGNTTISSTIAGNGGCLVFQTGFPTISLYLSGNNTYTGGTYLNRGWMYINSGGTSSSNSAIGTGTLTLNGNSAVTAIGCSGTVTLKTNNAQVWNGSFGFLGGNLNLGTGAVTLGAPNITLSDEFGGGSLTVGGNVTGTGNLTVATGGTATLSLSGTSYNPTGSFTNSGSGTGTTTISANIGSNVTGITQSGTGSLLLSGTSINPTGAITISGSAFGTTTISGNIGTNVTGIIQNSTNSSLLLSGNNTYTCGTTINAGTINAGSTSAFGTNSAVTLANVASATLNQNGYNISIGSLTGGGTTGGTVSTGGMTLTVGGDNTSPAAYAGVITGSGGLNKIGTGTLTLSGANGYTNPTIYNGALAINTVVNVGTAQPLGISTTVTFSGASSSAPGVLQYTGGTATLGQNLTVANGAYGMVDNSGGGVLTLGGTISKNGSVLTLDGGSFVVSGTITGTNPNSDIDLGSTTYPGTTIVGLHTANSYNGPTFITNGSTLLTGSDGALPPTPPSAVTLGATSDTSGQTNTLDLLGHNETVASLTANGPGANQIISSNGAASGTPAIGSIASSTTGTLTVNYSGSTPDVFSGSLGGSGGLNNFNLAVTGTGTVILSGATTYSGSTTVSAGELVFNTSLTSTSAISVASNATLDLASGTFSTSGTVTNTGTIILGNGVTLSSTGTFTNNGVLDLSNDPTFTLPGNFVNNGTVLPYIGPTDTPTLQPWAFIALGLLLFAAGAVLLPKPAVSRGKTSR